MIGSAVDDLDGPDLDFVLERLARAVFRPELVGPDAHPAVRRRLARRRLRKCGRR